MVEHLKFVNYHEYCYLCKHKEKPEEAEPCYICLAEPVNLESRKPVKFERKEQ